MREGGFAPDGYTFRLLLGAIKAWSDLEGALAQQAQRAHDAQQASEPHQAQQAQQAPCMPWCHSLHACLDI